MSRLCGGCRYFYPVKTIDEWGSGAEAVEGECRRLPPQKNPTSGGYAEWPVVPAEDWCGEHVAGSFRDGGYE